METRSPRKPASARRVSKTDWLAAALDLLRVGGIEAVRVERLAAKLGVAKSGFYYHFKGHAQLREALLDFWLNLDHIPMDEALKTREKPPKERLRIIVESVDREDLDRYDAAIRLWARQDEAARAVWREGMARRIDLIRGIFADAGVPEDELDLRTRAFIALTAGERDFFDDLSKADRKKQRELRLRLFLPDED